MPNLGPTELMIILLIVVILFGAGRIAHLGTELGGAIANFRKEVNDKETPSTEDNVVESPQA